nr:small, acid-soluble spore protein, alpha/beta type [Garciella nitratireducens]
MVMVKSKKTKKKKKELTPEDIMKYEIARELGLLDKVKEYGWGGLTARETGRIGGIMTQKKRMMNQKKEEE